MGVRRQLTELAWLDYRGSAVGHECDGKAGNARRSKAQNLLIIMIPGAPGVGMVYTEFLAQTMARLRQLLEESTAQKILDQPRLCSPGRFAAVSVSWAGHFSVPAYGHRVFGSRHPNGNREA